MKKRIFTAVVLFFILIASLTLVSCSDIADEVSVYRIYYYIDGSDGVRSEVAVTQNEHYSIEVPVKAYHTFLGFFDAEVGGTKFVNAAGMSVDKYVQDGDITLYAQWQADSFVVRFNLNGGSGAVNDLDVTYGTDLTALPVNVEKEGYSFLGWFSAAEGGVQYANKDGVLPGKRKLNETNYTLTEDKIINFFAQYELLLYTVTFDANGLGKNGVNSWEVKIPHGELMDAYAPTDGFLEEGKWSAISKWGSSKTTDKAYAQTITSNMTLYARARNLAIVLDVNGGGRVKSIFAEAGVAVALPEIERSGYTFKGWLNKEGLKKEYTIMPEEGDSLTASWETIIYTITYNLDGGALPTEKSNPASYTIETDTINFEEPTKQGTDFKFLGWYTSDDVKITSIPKGSTGNVSVKAKWKDVSKFAGFVEISTAGQLKNMSNNPAGNYYLSADINLNNAEWMPVGRYGGAFSGIFDGNGHTISNMKITVGTNHTTTLYSETEDIIVAYIGFFGSNSGTVRNVGILNANINVASIANIYGGILAGYNSGTIENSYVTGSIICSSSYKYGCDVGGLVGSNGSVVTNCYSTATVSATTTSSTGESYASAGGLCGTLLTTAGKLQKSFSTGNISVSCSGGSVYCGKFLGDNYGAGTVAACYYLSTATISGGNDPGNSGISISASDLKKENFYKNTLAFNDEIWILADGSYPELKK